MANIKAGYKQTDIGVIPEDWDVRPVSALCDIVSGGTPSTANLAFWFKGDIPWCTPSDITDTSGKYLRKTNRNITSLGLSKSSANLLPEGSLLLCSRATIGEVKIANSKIATNQGFKSLICHSVDNEFMYYKVLTLKDRLLQFSIGSTFLEFSKKDIARLQIVLPKPEEQKQIAAVLSDVDGLIESLQQLIAKKRDMKTAAMQQLLTGKKRLPGFDGEWEEKNMTQDSYLKARIGWQGLTTAEYLETGKYILITGTDFKNGKVDWNNCCYVEQERYDQDKNIQVSLGDILLTKDGTIGKVAYVDQLPEPATLNSGVFVIRSINESYHPLYFYYVLRSEIFKDFLNKLQAGSTISHLYQKDFIHFSFMSPPVPEQKSIAQILSDMDTEIEALEQRLEKARSLKTGMMQVLLTGKTRLVQPVKQVQKSKNKHNQHFEYAVIIAVLADKFGSQKFPLGHFRYMKFSYLLDRYQGKNVDAYLKKAAGPYNPTIRYGGAEKIAKDSGYVQEKKGGFIAGEHIDVAKKYFYEWFGFDSLDWLEQFRKIKNERLELWTTVDKAVQELKKQNKGITVVRVKSILESDREWKNKLSREIFSDMNIQNAINKSRYLFGY